MYRIAVTFISHFGDVMQIDFGKLPRPIRAHENQAAFTLSSYRQERYGECMLANPLNFWKAPDSSPVMGSDNDSFRLVILPTSSAGHNAPHFWETVRSDDRELNLEGTGFRELGNSTRDARCGETGWQLCL